MHDEPLGIKSGEIQLLAVYDVADEIDLGRLELLLHAAPRDRVPQEIGRLTLERQPGSLAFADPPVAARIADSRLDVDGLSLAVGVRVRFYDFGALAVQWSVAVPDGCTIEDLVGLSVALEAPAVQADLAGRMGADADAAMAAVVPALSQPGRNGPPETFTVYVVNRFDRAVSAEELLASGAVARMVVGEQDALSPQLHAEVRAGSFSYTDRDLVTISYDQAFVYDPVSAADISALLEFALAQVLELGFYDAELDARLAVLGQAIREPARHARRWGLGRSRFETLRREVLVQHVELVQVLERVTTAVKVTEDLHYARIYRAAMRIFRAGELSDASNRKLELVFRTYTMLADEVDSHVAHRLEWIIIVLILIEIVLGIAEKL